MDQIIENVKQLYEIYGSKIDSDTKLLILYWQKIDQCEISKSGIVTSDVIKKGTDPKLILSGKRAYEVLLKSDTQ